MKYLLQAIDAQRDNVRLSDHELRDLLVEVRSGKDDRIEFIESMTRLLDELKGSEHASAFLAKVSKRDAPDYYEVIKNPMDLGTMMRNVRSGRYKSKAQFTRDLDLIWDNCLTYNSEPTHPLRRSVQVLRAKANHLLTYVNDTNDVKEALNQWQASLGLSQKSSLDPPSASTMPWYETTAALDGAVASTKDRSGMNLGSMSMIMDTPFEQRPALLRNPHNMSTFHSLDDTLATTDDAFERRYMLSEPGPSCRPLEWDTRNESRIEAPAAAELLKTLQSTNQGGVLHSTLSQDAPESPTEGHDHVPYPFTEEESPSGWTRDAALWWNSTTHPTLLPNGFSTLPRSQVLQVKRMRRIGDRSLKRRKRAYSATEKGSSSRVAWERDAGAPYDFGGMTSIQDNVSTIVKLRRTHAKYGSLIHHIESGEPVPADLVVVSSDEEEDDEDDHKRGLAAHKGSSRRTADILMLPYSEVAGNPHHKVSGEGASEILKNKSQLLLAHAGFEGCQRSAADVLADLAGDFMMNLGRTFRAYIDRFAREMSVEELILHALHENGGMGISVLEKYVSNDVLRYGHKMSELLRKLRSSYRETLGSADIVMADEVAFFAPEHDGGQTNKGQSFHTNDDGEQLMRGGLALDVADDDFFGFKDLGLDQELGVDLGRQLASMPSRFFSRRGLPDGGKASGGGMKKGGVNTGDDVLEFDLPPPHIPLSEAGISAQIGLLQPFYRDLLRSRGQWQRLETSDEDATENRQEHSSENAYLILPDEEHERHRYKVPPTGKMPKRAMLNETDQGKTNTKPNDTRSKDTVPPASQSQPAPQKKKGFGGGKSRKDTSANRSATPLAV